MLVHNKKKNLGIIFESLLQAMIESKLNNDDIMKKRISDIISKFFIKESLLKEEFVLFNSILNSKFDNRDDAKKYIIECTNLINNLKENYDERNRLKSLLVDNINNVSKDILNRPIKNEEIYKTVNLIFEYRCKNKGMIEINNLIELEKKLVEHIISNNPSNNITTVKESIDDSDEYDEIEYLSKIIKYKEKYLNKLNENQRILIESYMQDDKKFNKLLESKYVENYNTLYEYYKKETDKNTKSKLSDVLKAFHKRYNQTKDLEKKLEVVLDSYSLLRK